MVLAPGKDVTCCSLLEPEAWSPEVVSSSGVSGWWDWCLCTSIRAVDQATFNLETPEAETEASGVYGLKPAEEPYQV